ncbi:hypothetical protein ACWF99_23870 [Nocardia sp. NPDC055002]
MDTREYFDTLHQLWSKTTYATFDGLWLAHEAEVMAAAEGNDKLVATQVDPFDAQFIATVHGALPSIIRLVHDALDEADRLDAEKDDLHSRIAELEMEITELNKHINDLEVH